MQLEPSKNAIENYKGVMLCSRPGDDSTPQAPKPFCARVVPPDALGLLPFKKPAEEKPLRKKNGIVSRHKKWLEGFQLQQIIRKEQTEQERDKEEQKFKAIRQQAEQDRRKAKVMREEYNTVSKNVMNILDDDDSKPKEAKLNADNLRKLNELALQSESSPANEAPQAANRNPMKKKKQKPAWAQTSEQIEQQEQDQENELLNFFETTDVEEFINDTEVTAIMKALKEKIDVIKKEEGWKEKQAAKAKEQQRQQRQAGQEQQQEDNRSEAGSKASEGSKSVASEKTSKKIDELKQKLERKNQGLQEDWQKSSKTSKPTYANYQERIAKNVADEVLRSYGNFKGVHSNNSVRRLLEREAARQLVEPHPRPIITTLIKEKTALDMNNLPYLHRNPAI